MTAVLVLAAIGLEAAHVPARFTTVITGIGKVEAAAATARAIAEHEPDLVINVGTAGALLPGLTGLHLPSEVLNHDLDAASIRALGGVAVDEIAVEGGDGSVLATGDVFVTDEVVRDHLGRRAGLVDMEGFAVARTCQVLGVPVRLVKVVSDGADATAFDWMSAVDGCARTIGAWLDANA